MNFNQASPTSEFRIRCLFSSPLAIGAFTSSSYYTVLSTDAFGANPSIAGLVAIPHTPNAVDIVLASALIPGGHYTVTVTGVPGADSTTATGSSAIYWGAQVSQENQEPIQNDVDAFLFGEDLIFTGTDYMETANGDLATVAGISNAIGAVSRRVLSDGLPWDNTYGAHPNQYVNAPPSAGLTLRGAIMADVLKDNRVRKVTVDFQQDSDSNSYFVVTPTFLNGQNDTSIQAPIAS